MQTFKVLVSDKLSDAGLAILKANPSITCDYKTGLNEDELCKIIGEYDALVIRSATKVTAKVLDHAAKLRVIGRAGIGVDNVDVPVASKRGILVMNTPSGNAVTTAEHAITLWMSLARKIAQATASMKNGKWEKTKFQGREVSGKVLGIVGLGNIGRIVADRAQGLKMKVIAFDPMISDDRAAALGVHKVSIDELFKSADIISCHAPLTPDTKNLLNDAAFEKMKNGVMIVNAARGGIVDESALLRAIEKGKVAGAALDVFEQEPVDPNHPLLKREEVICTPHLGASTEEAQERVALEIAEQIAEYLTQGVVRNSVNAPALSPEIAERLTPYTRLAGRLGRFLGRLPVQNVKELHVTCSGTAAELSARSIAHAVLAEYLTQHLEQPVSAISAPIVAKERGIQLVEICQDNKAGLTNLVTVTVKGSPESHSVSGTVSPSGDSRLIAFDKYELDALLSGTLLVIYNEDQPGVIGAVGTVLGNKQINVSRMQVGLESNSKRALALWNVDTTPDDATLSAIGKLPNVQNAMCIVL